MQKFITIPLVIGTNPAPVPGGEIPDVEEKVVRGKIDPALIAAYHPGYHWGTFIYITSGQVLLTRMKFEEVDELLSNIK